VDPVHDASNLIAAMRLAIDLLGDERLPAEQRALVLARMRADLEQLAQQLDRLP
jgi:hypothetical protein